MPDWGGIGAGSAAAGFLNGFAQQYAQANYERQQRAAHQEAVLLNMFSQAIQSDPTITTNPGFYGAVQSSGLQPEAAQVLSTFGQLVAKSPQTQQMAQAQEIMGQLRQGVRNRFAPLPADVAGPPTPPPSIDTLSPAEGYALGGKNLATALYEGGVLKNRATNAQSLKPTIQYHKVQRGDQNVTVKTTIQPQPDGTSTVTEEDVASGPSYQGRKIRPAGEKEIGVFTEGNGLIQQLDDLEQKIQQNPRLAELLSSKATVARQLGSELTASSTLKGLIASSGLTQDEADFLSDISRFVNKDIYNFGGKTVTGREASLVTQQVPIIGQKPAVFLGRLQQTRRNVVRVLAARAKAMTQSGIEAVPEIAVSRDPKAAELAIQGNRHSKAVLASPATGTGPAYNPADDAALNAAFLGQ